MFENFFTPDTMMRYLSLIIIIVLCFPIHESAHGYAALKLGDPTAKYQGRITLNPLAHLDPIGTLMMFFAGFGYAKPVPVNPTNFKRSISMKKGMAITAAAGPLSNLAMALLFILIYKTLLPFVPANSLESGGFMSILSLIMYYIVWINISLAVFNMLPIPPLDGSKIFALFLPERYYYMLMQYERFIMIGLFFLILTGRLSGPIGFVTGGVYFILDKLTFFMDFIPRMVG